MTNEEVAALSCGDKVFWSDPDDGACSRFYMIASIEVASDFVSITEHNGSYLECYAHELSDEPLFFSDYFSDTDCEPHSWKLE